MFYNHESDKMYFGPRATHEFNKVANPTPMGGRKK